MASPWRSGLLADAFSFLIGHRVSIYKKLWEEPGAGAGDELGWRPGFLPSLLPPATSVSIKCVLCKAGCCP